MNEAASTPVKQGKRHWGKKKKVKAILQWNYLYGHVEDFLSLVASEAWISIFMKRVL